MSDEDLENFVIKWKLLDAGGPEIWTVRPRIIWTVRVAREISPALRVRGSAPKLLQLSKRRYPES
jgi:hypothetical protein